MIPKGENALVEWLRTRLRADPARVPIGIGDDMAAVRLDAPLVTITTDMLLDGVHFDARQHGYDAIGRKALACSLSDCAAMGCEPRCATISLALNRDMSLDDVKRLYEGLARLADEFHCPIVGGDTNSWSAPLAIDVAVLGEPMSPRGPIRRSTAQPGDRLYVSGKLGGSILGKHLTFTPQLALARKLVNEVELHAMMDISDGLSLDLYRMCIASGCDAEVDAERLQSVISEAAQTLSMQTGRAPLEHALSDGEDFELLVAGGEELANARFDLLTIGKIISASQPERAGMTLVQVDGRRVPLEPSGYEHFT